VGKGARGRQQAWVTSEGGSHSPVIPKRPLEFWWVASLWIPRQHVRADGVDVRGFVADANAKIAKRGFVLYDGQVLTKPITDVAVPEGFIAPTFRSLDALTAEGLIAGPSGATFADPIKVGEHTEIIFEYHEDGAPFTASSLRDWGQAQQQFFRLERPYQMAEDPLEYTWCHLMTRVVEPYLKHEERIAALLHGEADEYPFYCRCHSAEVVYTTRGRLICMSCGAMHLVLREPLKLEPKRLLTPGEWLEYFGESGPGRDQEVELTMLDFRAVEHAETIWTTDQWEDAKHRFVFFSRSSPEEIQAATRNTEMDASAFLEAGWNPIELPSPPAHQLAEDSVDIDLIQNAAHALDAGVGDFLSARSNAQWLVNGIPQLFRTVELLLKSRLAEHDPSALSDQPNNPTVLKRLVAAGVPIAKNEHETIKRLRGLRNQLQHGAARFNHRAGLAVSRAAIVFIDRFAHDELDLWIADAITPTKWIRLLEIAELAATATRVVAGRLVEATTSPSADISWCPTCGEQAMLRPHPGTGASCLFCHHVPLVRDMDDDGG